MAITKNEQKNIKWISTKSSFSCALLYSKLLSKVSDKYTAAASQYQSCDPVAKIQHQESVRKMKNVPSGRSISRLSENFNGKYNSEGARKARFLITETSN